MTGIGPTFANAHAAYLKEFYLPKPSSLRYSVVSTTATDHVSRDIPWALFCRPEILNP